MGEKREDFRKLWMRQVNLLYLRFTNHCETLDQVQRLAAKRGYDPERVEMARRKLIGENARSSGGEARDWAEHWLGQGKDADWVTRELVQLGNEELFARRLVARVAAPSTACQRHISQGSPSRERPSRRKPAKVVAGDLPIYRTKSFSGLQHALKDLLWRVAYPQQVRDLVPHVAHDAKTVYAALRALAEKGELVCTTIKGTRIDRFASVGPRRGWFSESDQRLVSERNLAARGVHSRDTIKYRLGRGIPADRAASEPLQARKSHPQSTAKSATQTATQKRAWVAESGSKATIRSSPSTVDKETDTGRSPSATTPSPWKEKGGQSSSWHEKHLKAVSDRRRRETLDDLDAGVDEEEYPQPGKDSVLGPERPDQEFLRSLGILPARQSEMNVARRESRVGVVHMSALDTDEE